MIRRKKETPNTTRSTTTDASRRRPFAQSAGFAWPIAGVLLFVLLFGFGTRCKSAIGNKQPENAFLSASAGCKDNQNYALAQRESNGFFTDISSLDWERMRNITLKRANNAYPSNPLRDLKSATTWYQTNWDPDFSCRHDTKVGVGDGGKWVCDPMRLVDQSRNRRRMRLEATQMTDGNTSANPNIDEMPGCLIYSIGSDGNFAFEEGIIELLGNDVCEIHTFDFTNYENKVPAGMNIHFHAWGLQPSYKETKSTSGQYNGWNGGFGQQPTNRGVFKTLDQTIYELGHSGMPIDIFKIDCEGCEWGTYKDWVRADLRQLLIEVHSVLPISQDFFAELQNAGYVTFHKEPNIQWSGGECVEYAMLKLDRSYVEEKLNVPLVNITML